MKSISASVPALWSASDAIIVSDSVSEPARIISKAQQLRSREKNQIQENFEAENFEVGTVFIWVKTISLLKRQLSQFGSAFIGEMLQRPDIDEFSDVNQSISEFEAISLARDLGMLSAVQTMRLLHAREVISFFTGASDEFNSDDQAEMSKEEAISCLRVCVQGVLGHERIDAAQDFKEFRKKIQSTDLTLDDREIRLLAQSPYFFVKTAISVSLNLIRSLKGAQLEHVARNTVLIVSKFWHMLKGPERWQIGQAYSEMFNEGRKEAVKALYNILIEVNGFDYVPENLRSSTFTKVAAQVISAHQGMDNFYNEVSPMRELANLGTSIPGPALAQCITATLCVKMGNPYGVSNGAQIYADKLLTYISESRWNYYIEDCLPEERIILSKLSSSAPRKNWTRLMRTKNIDVSAIKNPLIKKLMRFTKSNDDDQVRQAANRLLQKSLD